jgi:hypothetical protein
LHRSGKSSAYGIVVENSEENRSLARGIDGSEILKRILE